MDPETLNAMNEGMYLALLTLIEGITLITGLASALFVILCLGCAALGAFAERSLDRFNWSPGENAQAACPAQRGAAGTSETASMAA